MNRPIHGGSRVRWFIRRILPYRTSENRIEGVAITYSEITEIKRTSDRLKRRDRQVSALYELGRMALEGGDLDALFQEVVRKLTEVLNVEFAKVLQLSEEGDNLSLRTGIGWPPRAGRVHDSSGCERVPRPATPSIRVSRLLQTT